MALKTCRNSKNLITNRSRERPLILGQLAKGRNYSVYYEYLYEDQDEQMYLNRRRALIGYSQGNNLLNPNGCVLMRSVLCRRGSFEALSPGETTPVFNNLEGISDLKDF